MQLEYLLMTYKNPEMFCRALRSVGAEACVADVSCSIIDDCEREALDESGVYNHAKSRLALANNDHALHSVRQIGDTMEEKKGHMKSRMGWGLNRCVYDSASDLVMMLCDDDAIIPGASRKVIEWFDAHPEEQWAYGSALAFDASGTGEYPGLPTFEEALKDVHEIKPLVCGQSQEMGHNPTRTRAANVLGVQNIVWRREAQVKRDIKWMEESHPKRHPIDHQVFHQFDGGFHEECPFIGFPIQFKGCHPGQVSRW